jgi:hypothetical protein
MRASTSPGGNIQCHQGNDDLVEIIVKGAQELSPEETEEASIFQDVDIFACGHIVSALLGLFSGKNGA